MKEEQEKGKPTFAEYSYFNVHAQIPIPPSSLTKKHSKLHKWKTALGAECHTQLEKWFVPSTDHLSVAQCSGEK